MAKKQESTVGINFHMSVRTLISARQGAKMTGVAESTWWEWARTFKDFPKPIRISPRCTRWDQAEIEGWLESRRTA